MESSDANQKQEQIVPEVYWIKPTPYVPNSKLPVLVYRSALQNFSPEETEAKISPNKWTKGGQWKTYKIPHFHVTAHECYYVIRGRSHYNLGKSPVDQDFNEKGERNGIELMVSAGDVFVLPAGISHASIETWDDYEYMGFYSPIVPKFRGREDMHWGKSLEDMPELTKIAADCPVPDYDPLYGKDGPLSTLWKAELNKI